MSISNAESGDTGLKAEPVRSRECHSGWGRSRRATWKKDKSQPGTLKSAGAGHHPENNQDYRKRFVQFGRFRVPVRSAEWKSNLRPHFNSACLFVLKLARKNKTSISSSLPDNEPVSTAPRLWRPLKQDAYQRQQDMASTSLETIEGGQRLWEACVYRMTHWWRIGSTMCCNP